MVSGGKRKGAGRPKGQGPYGEATKPIRIPESLLDKVLNFVQHKAYSLPLYESRVAAGFPSPADDYSDKSLDLNEYLIKHPSATYFVRVEGESMLNAGIFPNDILVVDRSIEAKDGKVVVAALNGELTVKRLSVRSSKNYLLPENDAYAPIEVTDECNFHIWGVVTSVIHHV